MSLFSSIGNALRGVAGIALPAIGTALGGPVGGALGGVFGSAVQRSPKLPAMPGSGFVASNLGTRIDTLRLPSAPASVQPASLLDPGVPGPGVFSPTQPPPGYHLSKRAPFHFVKNRRMNPLNPRALRRATRRLTMFQKEVKRTEKALRKLAPPSYRRRAAVRHITGPQHTR